MSIPDRLFRLSKAYLGEVRDRIDGALSEREAALRELEGRDAPRLQDMDNSESIMRRAEEKIAATRREMEARRELRPAAGESVAPATAAATEAGEATHYKVLGVPPGSDYATVQAAYDKLLKRLDPNRFETDADKAEAERIMKRVQAAYEALAEKLDPTEGRMRRLEL